MTKETLKEIWDKMNRNEQFGCRFGLFPLWVKEQYNPTKDDIVDLTEFKTKVSAPIKFVKFHL